LRVTVASLLTSARSLLSKVPEVTLFFWIIKVLCTTVGETVADTLIDTYNLGLPRTTIIIAAALAGVLVWQFLLRRYVPAVYWLAVVLISVVGTLITDNLTDRYHVPLETSTLIFAVILAVVFIAWYRSERTLSIHSILTPRREASYWLAVLFTFALGTAAGDLVAERLDIGFWKPALIFAAVIGLVGLANLYLKLNGVLAFWIAYILTRPLGANLGDYLSQDRDAGGRALGKPAVSAVFLVAILGIIVYLSVSRRDQIQNVDLA
jgi:uncharacterized membrane-anchored protein